MTGSITEQMTAAKLKMIERKRTPRVFFLSPNDYAAFVRTSPDYGWVPFHQLGRPTELFCPLFEALAVRQSQAKNPKSSLFCCVGTRVPVRAA